VIWDWLEWLLTQTDYYRPGERGRKTLANLNAETRRCQKSGERFFVRNPLRQPGWQGHGERFG
jgi:hypothetical protein